MAYNGMHGQTDEMRTAASRITAAKPVAPVWGVSPIPATMMAGVKALNDGCTNAVQRGEGFVASVADGFDLFGQILQLCANDYDQNDTAGAQSIARAEAASLAQAGKVDELDRSRYFDHVSHYGIPGDTNFVLPPDGWGVK